MTTASLAETSPPKVVQIERFAPLEFLRKKLPELPTMNRRVVELMLQFPREGQHDYWWPRKGESSYDGATTDVIFADLKLMAGEEKGRTFCCGLTLEVCYRSLGMEARLPDALTSETADAFKKLWFCREIFSPGPEEALEQFGLGKRVAHSEALPGDFVQLWRHNRSGHSVIFVDWARDPADKIIGLHYWSTQPATAGINFNTELFGTAGKSVDRSKLSISRLQPPDQWRDAATSAAATIGTVQ